MRHLLRTAIVALCMLSAVAGCDTPATPPSPPRAPVLLKTVPVKAYNVIAAVAANPRSGHVYIMLDDHVTIFKDTEVIIDLKITNKWAESIAVDEANDRAYLSNALEDTVSVIEGTRLITNVVTLGRSTPLVMVEPRSHLAYAVSQYGKAPYDVAGSLNGNVLVLDGTRVVANIRVEDIILSRMAVDPVGGYVYVGGVSGGVAAIKGTQIVARYEGVPDRNGPGPVQDMQTDSRTGEVFVLDGRSYIRIFKDGKVRDTTHLENKGDGTLAGLGIHPQTSLRYLIDRANNVVRIMQGWQEIQRVPVPFSRYSYAQKLAIDPFTGNVYVIDSYTDTLTVIHGTEIIGTLKTGWHPGALGVNPANGQVYVVNVGDSTVSIYGFP